MHMCYNFIVEFEVMKGLGPDFVTKLVDVGYDDVDADVPEYVVREWAKKDAEAHLKRLGSEIEKFMFVDIHNA